jgi:hypothetical protein
MFKALFGLIKLAILLIVLALIFHNYAARKALAFYLQSALGAPVEIQSAQVDLLGSKAFFRNILIKNSEDFPEGHIAKIPYLLVDLDFAAFSDGRLHFEKIEVDLGDFQILRNADGRVNWLNLKIIQNAQQKPSEAVSPQKGAKIDHFIVTLRKGTYRDLSKSGPPRTIILEMESQDYMNVHTLEDMVMVISWEAMKRMGLEKLGAGVLDQIRQDLEDSYV